MSRIGARNGQSVSLLLVAALVFMAVPTASGGSVIGLNTFTNGTTADADQVNANFTAVKTAVDDNDMRITALEGGGQVFATPGLVMPASFTTFAMYSAAGTENNAQLMMSRGGTLTGLVIRTPSAALPAGCSITVEVRVNGVSAIGLSLTRTLAQGTAVQTTGAALAVVSPGDLVGFRIRETGGVAAGTQIFSSVTLK